MNKNIAFDMDGTIADFYSVPNWKDKLKAEDTYPYDNAKPLINMNVLAKLLNKLQKNGYTLQIISWVARGSAFDYALDIVEAKRKWLKKHLPSVKWNDISIVNYGDEKSKFSMATNCILFDDNENVRKEWNKNNGGIAYNEKMIIEVLKSL